MKDLISLFHSLLLTTGVDPFHTDSIDPMDFNDFQTLRNAAATALASTLLLLMVVSSKYVPYIPVEFSQMGWGIPGARGGYLIMASGMSVVAACLFRYHILERSALGATAAVFVALLGIINGNDVSLLQTTHGVVACIAFVLYIIYIATRGGGSVYAIAIATISLVIAHTVIFQKLDWRTLWQNGIADWPPIWTAAQAVQPTWVLQIKAICQIIMIIAFFYSLLTLPLPTY